MKNWKLFGISIFWVTIIPCYYDLLRYKRVLNTFAVKNLNIVRFTTISYRFRQLFDTSLI
jgi:hypothetical protein